MTDKSDEWDFKRTHTIVPDSVTIAEFRKEVERLSQEDSSNVREIDRLRTALATAEAALEDIRQDLPYVMGFNAGFDHAMDETLQMQFPTMLRKMWLGGEVQKWLDEKKAAIRALKVKP
jgi:hypothetical protein